MLNDDAVTAYHDHLDECRQCEQDKLYPCSIGAVLVEKIFFEEIHETSDTQEC